MVHAVNPGTGEMEAGGSEIKGHFWTQRVGTQRGLHEILSQNVLKVIVIRYKGSHPND